MKYSNLSFSELPPQAGEGRQLLLRFGVAGAVVAALIGLLMLFSDWLAVHIPFSSEQAFAQPVVAQLNGRAKSAIPVDPAEKALRQVAARVAAAMDLPAGMTITVHLVDSPLVNAMATLGGHVFVYRGLLERLRSEDALAAVLAHEMAHVRARHVIRGIGRGVVLVAALGAIGVKNQGLTQWALGKGTELGSLSFSRDAETEADAIALEAVHRLYGHTAGLTELFTLFAQLGGGGVELLRTHPLSENRLKGLSARAATQGYATAGALQPLPPGLDALFLNDGSRSTPAAGRDNRPG